MKNLSKVSLNVMRPSLNRMVLDSLHILEVKENKDYSTAREVKDNIEKVYDISYPIQTIIVVLNRFTVRGVVNRVTYAGEEVRQRYGYYLSQSPQEVLEEKIWARFKAFADEFYQGDFHEAVLGANKLLVKKEMQHSAPERRSNKPVKKVKTVKKR